MCASAKLYASTRWAALTSGSCPAASACAKAARVQRASGAARIVLGERASLRAQPERRGQRAARQHDAPVAVGAAHPLAVALLAQSVDEHKLHAAHLRLVGSARALVEGRDHLGQPPLLGRLGYIVEQLAVRVGLLAHRIGEHESLVEAHLLEQGEGIGVVGLAVIATLHRGEHRGGATLGGDVQRLAGVGPRGKHGEQRVGEVLGVRRGEAEANLWVGDAQLVEKLSKAEGAGLLRHLGGKSLTQRGGSGRLGCDGGRHDGDGDGLPLRLLRVLIRSRVGVVLVRVGVGVGCQLQRRVGRRARYEARYDARVFGVHVRVDVLAEHRYLAHATLDELGDLSRDGGGIA
eukprot:scaffold12515_cov56-Phaeocystis_antarctica.AAC.7